MDSSISGDAAPGTRSSRKKLIFYGCVIVICFFCINDILGLINGGGIFSSISGMVAVQKGARSVDVDGAGLRILFVAACALVASTLAALLKADMDERVTGAVFILSIIGGGFVLDAIYGPSVADGYMKSRGYVRCPALDHSRGRGKGTVWFSNYVLNKADCPPARPRM